MLSVSIMTVIIIGLYTVFDQTQRALRSTVSQVDVLESVRAASDILVRDFEGATPVRLADTNATSMAAFANPFAVPVDLNGLTAARGSVMRTHIQDMYLVTRQNDFWRGVGYWVGPSNTNLLGETFSVGRLYRFDFETSASAFGVTNLFLRFQSADRLASSQPVMDGVVHLRLIAYDRDGMPLAYDPLNKDRPYPARNSESMISPTSWFPDPNRDEAMAYRFQRWRHPEFPAAVELEIGVLESQMVTRFNAIPVAAEARKFLARNAGKVHLFRYKIPLRNSPPS